MRKAIATAPGEPTQYVTMTNKEVNDLETSRFETPKPTPLDEQVSQAFAALPLEMQVKFTPEITQFEMLFRRGNFPVILAKIDLMAAGLQLPEEQAVKDILDAAKAALEG